MRDEDVQEPDTEVQLHQSLVLPPWLTGVDELKVGLLSNGGDALSHDGRLTGMRLGARVSSGAAA